MQKRNGRNRKNLEQLTEKRKKNLGGREGEINKRRESALLVCPCAEDASCKLCFAKRKHISKVDKVEFVGGRVVAESW